MNREAPLQQIHDAVAAWDGLDERTAGQMIAEILAALELTHGRPIESLHIMTDPTPMSGSYIATPIHKRRVVVTLRTMMHSVWET